MERKVRVARDDWIKREHDKQAKTNEKEYKNNF